MMRICENILLCFFSEHAIFKSTEAFSKHLVIWGSLEIVKFRICYKSLALSKEYSNIVGTLGDCLYFYAPAT